MNRLQWHRRIILALAAGVAAQIATPAAAQQRSAEEAEAAWAALSPQEAQRAGDPEYDYALLGLPLQGHSGQETPLEGEAATMTGAAPRGRSRGQYNPRRRPRWWLLALVILGHLAVGALLMRLLAPDFTAQVVERAQSQITVIVTTREEPENEPEPVLNENPDEGAAAEAGRDAQAREQAAPENLSPSPTPIPRAASTGTQNAAGATDTGDGTGAAGEGFGTGSGRSGQGRGGVPVSGPSVKSGSIDSARDFPIPEGGRQVRDGTSVTVVFTVGVDGRASDCSVRNPGPDPATNALVCPLVIERIRFNPAIDALGNPVPARYGWRQDFFRR